MSQILVRNVEPEVVEKLKARAKKNGRSLEAEARTILKQAIEISDDWRTQVEEIRKLFEGRSFIDSVELLREDRER